MSFSSNSGGGGPMSEINVTPLVDVMLVLLIIFMVTAPMVQAGLRVDLPNAEAPAIPQRRAEASRDHRPRRRRQSCVADFDLGRRRSHDPRAAG